MVLLAGCSMFCGLAKTEVARTAMRKMCLYMVKAVQGVLGIEML